MVLRGKYQRLYQYLSSLQAQEWRTSFSEVEAVIGFELPPSARLHRPWWGNQRGDSGHSHTLSWSVAGWETTEVDIDGEMLLLSIFVVFDRRFSRSLTPLEAQWSDYYHGVIFRSITSLSA